MDVHISTYLGGGPQGKVFGTTCGHVLKLTRSRHEAIICHHLRALQADGAVFRHLPLIRAIADFGDGVHAVLKSDAPNKAIVPDHDLAFARFDRGWTDGVAEDIAFAFTKMDALRPFHAELLEFRRVTGITLLDLGNPDNLGMVEGNLALRDLGKARGVSPEDIDLVAWDVITVHSPKWCGPRTSRVHERAPDRTLEMSF